MAAAEGSESRLGVDVSSATARSQSEVLLIGGSRTEAFDFYLNCVFCTLCSLLLALHDTNLNFGLSVVNSSYPFIRLGYIYFSSFLKYISLTLCERVRPSAPAAELSTSANV